MLSTRVVKKWVSIFKDKKLLVTALIVTCLLVFGVYNFSGVLFKLAHNTVDTISEKTGINLGKTYYDFESKINIFRPKNDLWTGDLPIYHFKLSANDIKHFDDLAEVSLEQGYLEKEEANTWRDIEVKYNGKTYNAKIRLRGDNPNQWGYALKSYSVKLEGNESINDLRRFNLIIFEDRLLDAKIVNILCKEFGLFDIRDDIVVLKINGVPQGVYYLVEGLDADFFEHNECSSCELIKTYANQIKDHPSEKKNENPYLDSSKPYGLYIPGHATYFDYELSNVNLQESDLDTKKVLNSVNNLFEAIKDEDSVRLLEFFDIDKITDFEAQRMISGFGQIAGDDLRMAYKGTNSKFYPIPFEEGLKPIKVENGGIERSLNVRTSTTGEAEVKLFVLLNRNDKIRQLKYKKAYKYITENGSLFLDQIDDLVNKYLPYANAHKGNLIGTKTIEQRIKSYKPLLEQNIAIIKDVLEYAKCYISIVEKDNRLVLEVIPDSVSQLRFEELKINLLKNNTYSGKVTLEYKDEDNKVITRQTSVEGKTDSVDLSSIIKEFYFSTGLDEKLGTKKRVYEIIINFEDTDKILLDNIKVSVINDITGKPLGEDEVYLQIANANDYYFDIISAKPDDFISMYDEFNWDYKDGVLTLLKGDYTLKRDMIVPKGLIWDIEPGVQILIDDDKSVVSYSPLNIKGAESEPVVIKALNPDKPFGVFAVVGEKGFKTTIDWLKLSYGNEKFINGMFLSGQLSLYHTDVDIRNSVFSGSHSDDGINIKYGKIMVDNCLFNNNFGDHFDGDFVEGVVKNSMFIEEDPNADDNGDGLDFSGSKVIVKNNIFKGFKDKGLSIGEETKHIVVYDNVFENNKLGSAIKDSSQAFFIQNTFKNNALALTAYQKKVIYTCGGSFYLHGNSFEDNAKSYELDEHSYKRDFSPEKGVYDKIIEKVNNEDVDGVFQILDGHTKECDQ